MSISSVETVSPRSISDHDVVAIDRDMAGDHRDDLLAQDCEQIGIAAIRPLVGKQDLQSFPRHRSGAAPSQTG